MQKAKATYVPPASSTKPKSSRSSTKKSQKKRPLDNSGSTTNRASKRKKVVDTSSEVDEDVSVEDEKDEDADNQAFKQPILVTGTKLKDYQLEGVAWMAGLYNNGISGILADEMGLGKTLQTIAFHAYLRERSPAPFLVVCPLSVLNNWADEFKKFAPEIPVCIYHGSPEERAEIRRTQMVVPTADRAKWWKGADISAASASKARKKLKRPLKAKGKSSTSSAKEMDDQDDSEPAADLPPHQRTTFPVVITTYEIVIRDVAELGMYRWGFIVVDEGHRLKNMECRLIRELKSLDAGSRMVLTGTPLQNNLAELWSLLNFVLPGVFTDLDTFQEWFTLPTTSFSTSHSSPRQTKLINTLHTILRPFLLRRLKVDVEADLPPKKEYILYAPLTVKQREVYDAILNGHLRAILMKGQDSFDVKLKRDKGKKDQDASYESIQTRSRGARKEMRKKYGVMDGDDDEYFRKLESGELEELEEGERDRHRGKSAEELGREWQLKARMKKINNLKLQNTVMQLRKVCSHPFLFDWPTNPTTMEPILDAQLVSASGKMMLLDQLLEELFKTRHKVLLFSQFTTMLDIIQDWAQELKGWEICRIDGSTKMETRREEVARFQTGGDDPDAPCLFLLSTRAGGLGLNLVAADTVIFYDQDWASLLSHFNPQMDLQAQDRAHRIGQTKPVLIFRLVTAHTIETKIMQRASEKRKLEALVIAKGKFRAPAQAALKTKAETQAEMAAELLSLETEQIKIALEGQSVIGRAEMEALLDRSPEVFSGRGKGWTSKEVMGEKIKEKEGQAAFAVYDAPVDEGSNALAGMMGEPEPSDLD
ncbi:SNF2 family N-terminal domain-containing protein [Irpex rosettiformis]|uniref:SNF2 family N-terminal domain-containing protein n=1 Tax=Irpex rosettiformis TaxID=378272 RepID=A0ACB8TRR5_9APHY|nr:SNF2 family N-terminal domain-containing protein [Irpex rosettiformis]